MTNHPVKECKVLLDEALKKGCPKDDLDRKVTLTVMRLAIISVFEPEKMPIKDWGTFIERSNDLWELSKSPLFDSDLFPEGDNLEDSAIGKVSEKVLEIFEKSENKIWEIGSIYENLISSDDRRKTGSHYTPVKLAKEVVAEAFRPWLESHNYNPSVEDILELKVCDPAVGAGVFLLEVVDFLDEFLKGKIERSKSEIVKRCLYGVDKGWFPVEVTKICLWLKADCPQFHTEFLRNKVVQGDSLVGVSLKDIENALETTNIGGNLERHLRQYKKQQSEIMHLFHSDSRSDADDDRKRQALESIENDSAYLRTVGDLLVAAHFNGRSKSDRADKREIYLAATTDCDSAAELELVMAEPLDILRGGEKGFRPLHWDLQFPDVYQRTAPGFDVFIGNPPFAGDVTFTDANLGGYYDWLKAKNPGSGGRCDLVAFFFRQTFLLLRSSGTSGLIATNTVAQGDTRTSGLRWICVNGGSIYSAWKRIKWPGVAAVVVSVVHILKGRYHGKRTLDGKPAREISAFLFANSNSQDPCVLKSNKNQSFKGAMIYGLGFTFEDSQLADETTPGKPSPINTMKHLLAESNRNDSVIFPYIGGEEVNSSPSHLHDRFVINFGTRSESDCRSRWPKLMQIVETKVRPEREKLKDNADGKKLKEKWWQFGRPSPSLFEAISKLPRVLVAARHQPNWQLAFMEPSSVFSEALAVFALNSAASFAALQSSVHEIWARFLGSSIKDDLRYTPSNCYETFAFPGCMSEVLQRQYCQGTGLLSSLEEIGDNYHQYRSKQMIANKQGLTETYNRFHDPEETSEGILELRRLHSEMDQAVLNAYGWSDIPTACGYGLDYLDTADDAELPEHLQDRIDSGDLFFWQADEAAAFRAELVAYGAVRPNRKLPWRYRWPDDVRDDVLARLLALNAERYAEEVAQGLHSGKHC